jgi:hypothetical protein
MVSGRKPTLWHIIEDYFMFTGINDFTVLLWLDVK